MKKKKYLKPPPPHGCFQQKSVPPNGWFIMENPIKMDDLGGFTPLARQFSKHQDAVRVKGTKGSAR